jgi:2-(1,2-epoxy-1,2-dihydrophenyl)acetyl-CoA isomerase
VTLRAWQEGAVAHIRFARPAALNAIDLELAEAFRDAVAAVPPTAGALVLSGEGRGFMAGGDVQAMRAAGEDAPALTARIIDAMHPAILALAALPCPVIASVQGPAAGAGLSLALGADLLIAAEDARFTLGYLGIGAPPDCGGSHALLRHLGLRRAMGFALLGETLDANAALALGLAHRVVRRDALEAETAKLAQRLAAGPRGAIAATKRLLRAAAETPLAAQLDAEREAFLASAATPDFREGVAAFLERRAPRFGDNETGRDTP